MKLKWLENISKKGWHLALFLCVVVCSLLIIHHSLLTSLAQGPPGVPATYYGAVTAGPDFAVTAGMTVTARVDGTLCGQDQTLSSNGQIIYGLLVQAEGPYHYGCGSSERAVTFWVDSQEMAPMLFWDNSQVREVALSPVDRQAIVIPSSSHVLTSTSVLSIVIPAGAVSQATTLAVTKLLTPTNSAPAEFAFAGLRFTLEAYDSHHGSPLTDFLFSQPIQVTLSYSDTDISSVTEESLLLHYWDGSAWVDAATTCTPTSTYQREPSANRLSVAICHLSEFALFGQPISRAIALQTGWSHISLPLFSPTSYTAQNLCDEMISQGGSVVEIDRWHTGGWDGHLCGLPFNDFAIELGESYFVRSNAASTWTITGQPITSAIPLNLQVGWNAISIPHTNSYSAESLCDHIINQGVSAVEIDRWHSGGWDGHICNFPFNDFAIERGVGYFIKSSSSGSVTPYIIMGDTSEPSMITVGAFNSTSSALSWLPMALAPLALTMLAMLALYIRYPLRNEN
jgi:hypothetical protein